MSQSRSLSPLERFLRLFTDIRPGEGRTALAMFASVFLILCAYYLMKPLREGWIAVSPIAGLEKMEVKAYTSFGQVMLLVPVIALYSRLVDAWPRGRVVSASTVFCMAMTLLFWTLQPGFFLENLPWTGIAFYLWISIFSVFVVGQFWAFAADIYSDEEGRRLLPVVAIGATAGAASGAKITEFLVEGGFPGVLSAIGLEPAAELARRILQTESLLLIACVPLGASLLLMRYVDRVRAVSSQAPVPASEGGPETSGGLGLVLGSSFLLLVATMTVLLNWVNTNGENLLFDVLQGVLEADAAALSLEGDALVLFTRDGTTAFYGNFFAWVNAVALILQAFVASRLLKYGGFGVILLLLPVVALTSYATMAVLPILAVVKGMKIAENATDYSINNTARHVLWLPVASEVKLKGKPTIDALFARVGDGMAALTVLIGVNLLNMDTPVFFAFNVFLVLVWLGVGFGIVRQHRGLTAEAETSVA